MKPHINNILDIKHIGFSFYNEENLFTKLNNYVKLGTKIAIAVSGGADSMFLACVIKKFYLSRGFDTGNLYFVHCNHKIRDESEEEEKFIKKFFAKSNLIIVSNPNKKLKKEHELRERRYKEFDNIVKRQNIEYFLFGHNLTDRIESSFLNMLRGAGLNGFLGMKFFEMHNILKIGVLRPLLSISKNQIFEFCKKIGIPYFDDKSNFDPEVSMRNKLRIEVLPKIFSLSNKDDGLSNTFIESMSNVYEEIEDPTPSPSPSRGGELLRGINLCEYWDAKWGYEIILSKDKINPSILFDTFAGLGIVNNINKKNLAEISDFLKNNKNGHKYINGTYIFISHEKLYLINAPKDFWKKRVDKVEDFQIGKKKVEAGCVVRYPRLGDKYKGKTLNRWFLNQKVPIFWRNFVPVLVNSNGDILLTYWGDCV